MSDHPADVHDGQDPEPADEPAPIEPGHIVELDERWMTTIVGSAPPVTRGTVQATTDRTAVVRVVIPVTVEVPLSDLRRCE